MELKVVKIFKDKENSTIYKVGDTLNVEDLNRVNDLVSRGLCVITSLDAKAENTAVVVFLEKEYDVKVVKDALVAIGVSVAANAGVNSITKKVSELTEEQALALGNILSKE